MNQLAAILEKLSVCAVRYLRIKPTEGRSPPEVLGIDVLCWVWLPRSLPSLWPQADLGVDQASGDVFQGMSALIPNHPEPVLITSPCEAVRALEFGKSTVGLGWSKEHSMRANWTV